MKSAKYLLDPLNSVGGIGFGSDEALLVRLHGLSRIQGEEVGPVGWNVYGDGDSIRAYCEAGKVVSIAVYSSLLFQDRDIIGMSFDELGCVTHADDVIFDDRVELSDGMRDVYDIPSLGMQVWILNGRVCSVTCDNGE